MNEQPPKNPPIFKLEAVMMLGYWLTVPVIGIIAAIAIPNLLRAIALPKQRQSAAAVKQVGDALLSNKEQLTRLALGKHYSAAEALATVESTPKLVSVDAWGNAIVVWRTDEGVYVVSSGSDGKLDQELPASFTRPATAKSDIVWFNGRFLSAPKGFQ